MLLHINYGNEGSVTFADRLALQFEKTIREGEEKLLQVGAVFSRGKKMRKRKTDREYITGRRKQRQAQVLYPSSLPPLIPPFL